MEEDAQEMEEVVVTGYQVIKKSNMAGSVSTIGAEDLILNGTQSLEQALQGKLPGVVVLNQDGLVGTRQKVRVRGTSTCWVVKNRCGSWTELYRKIHFLLKPRS